LRLRLAAQARVDPTPDRLFVDDLLQQLDQAFAVRRRHPVRQRFLVGLSDLATAGERLPPFRGEVEGTDAPIGGMRTALDQAALLEFVDEGDHAAGWHLDRLADRLLGATFGSIDEVEDAEQRRG
jgi:hypothetical protein